MLDSPERIDELIDRIRVLDLDDARFKSMVRANPWTHDLWEQVDARYGC